MFAQPRHKSLSQSPGAARPATRERGAALVELAIILPVLIILVLGVIDLGRVFYSYEALVNATREGARYCALNPTVSDALTRTRVQEELNAAESGVLLYTAPGLTECDVKCDQSGAGKEIVVRACSQFLPVTPLFDPVLLRVSSSMVQWKN